jgi:hypothetical protein
MPQASAYINKVRADTEGRNMKKEYPGAVLYPNNLGSLMCTNFTNPTTKLYQPPWWVTTKFTQFCGCNSK